MTRVVIVGGGLAAQRACQQLRTLGHDGPVQVVCAETELPYDRPPLSKAFLAGDDPVEQLSLRPRAWWDEHDVELLLGQAATGVDVARRRVAVGAGAELAYDRLLVATGAQPRALSGLPGRLEGVHQLRTVADALALRSDLRRARELVIVGAGLIGLEVASTAHALGVGVTVVESAGVPCVRALGPWGGRLLASLHRRQRVELLTRASVARLEHRRGRIHGVRLADGRRRACDALLVSIGAGAAGAWLAGSGLPTDGLRTDTSGRTAWPGIFAAGDVARPLDPGSGRHLASEHWEGAVNQGVAAARSMLGLPALPARLALVWSDQHGLRFHVLGSLAGATRLEIHGHPAAGEGHAVFHRDGRPVGALVVGDAGPLPSLRRRLQDARPQAFPPSTPEPKELAA